MTLQVLARLSLALSMAFVAALPGRESAHASAKVALVIGNSVYRNVPRLPNPPNDSRDVAASLERLGFAVTRVNDGTFDAMRRALLTFGREARGADMAVVFFAGHGIEVGGENWLIPIDAELKSDIDVDHEAIGLKGVMTTVESAARLGLVILDACRNNPFTARMAQSVRTRSVVRGLAHVEPSGNVLVAFAAKDGTLAADGNGRNSPFTEALLKHIETPGLEINFLFRNVRDDVIRTTNRVQQPFVYGSLSKEAIYLNPPLSAPSVALPPPPPGPAADEIAWAFLKDSKDAQALKRFIEQFPSSALRPQAEERIAALSSEPSPPLAAPPSRAGDFELAYWDSIKTSSNPGEFESYLKAYPDGAFVAIARLRLEELKRRAGPSQRPSGPAAPQRGNGKCFTFQGRQFCE